MVSKLLTVFSCMVALVAASTKGLEVETLGSRSLFTSPESGSIKEVVTPPRSRNRLSSQGPPEIKISSIVAANEFKQFGLMESPFDPQSPKEGFFYLFDERPSLADIAALCLSWCLRLTSCRATVTFRHFRHNACFLLEKEFETYYEEDERTLVTLDITQETLEKKSSGFREVPSRLFTIMSPDILTSISESISERTYYAYNVHTSQQTQSEKTPRSIKKGFPSKGIVVATPGSVKEATTHGSNSLTNKNLASSESHKKSTGRNKKPNKKNKKNGKKKQ